MIRYAWLSCSNKDDDDDDAAAAADDDDDDDDVTTRYFIGSSKYVPGKFTSASRNVACENSRPTPLGPGAMKDCCFRRLRETQFRARESFLLTVPVSYGPGIYGSFREPGPCRVAIIDTPFSSDQNGLKIYTPN